MCHTLTAMSFATLATISQLEHLIYLCDLITQMLTVDYLWTRITWIFLISKYQTFAHLPTSLLSVGMSLLSALISIQLVEA